MERIVIACYKPKPGKAKELKALVRKHHTELLKEGLVTARKPVLMQGVDGTVVEVFEWKSSQAMKDAHQNEAVQQMWQEFSEVSDYLPVGQVPEGQQLFSEFLPLKDR